MKIEKEIREDHQVRIVAEFDPADFEKYVQQAARKISRETKVPGFRPGKAPIAVIRRMVGDEAIQQQAVELMVDAVYPDVLTEADVTPSRAGSLEEIISIDPPKFAFIVPLQPEVDLGDYRSVRKEYAFEPVSDTEVDEFVKRLQTGYATTEEVERPAQDGDVVYLKLTGTLTDPDEEQEAEFIKETTFQVAIGDPTLSPDRWPYPGFSKELLGLAAGEEKEIEYIYPEDAEVEKVRGKRILFHVTIESVKALKLPELNDEFAKTMGNFETMDDLRVAARENLEQNKRQEYDRQYFNELVDAIAEGATVKYPPQYLDDEKDSVLHNVEHNLADQRMDMETYLKLMKMDRETFIAQEIEPAARKRLERSLIMDEIARAEDIKLQEGELRSAFDETFAELQQTTDLKAMQRQLSQKGMADAIAYEAASRAMNRAVLNRLKNIATGQADSVPAAAEEEAPVGEQVTASETPESTGPQDSATEETTDPTPPEA